MYKKQFFETIEDAIAVDIAAIHGSYKTVACQLWPSMKPGTAYGRLKNCLRDDQDAKLAPAELLLIKQWARDAGSRATLDYELDVCHCAASRPVEPAFERARLQREFVSMAGDMRRLMDRIEEFAGDEPEDSRVTDFSRRSA
jgi:hypothetical protein